MLPRVWPAKAPGDGLDYTLDCSGWVQDTNDPVATATATVTPSDIQVVAVVVVAAKAILWLSSGSPGRHIVAVTVTTVSGQTVTAHVALAIDPNVPVLAPEFPSLMTEGAAPIDAEDGTPILINAGEVAGTVTLPSGFALTSQAGVPLF